MCENCIYFVYDEYEDYYICTVNLDEDEMAAFVRGNTRNCPYFHDNDEYKIVRHQN